MNDKSSTSLALISVLSILIVLFIAISNVEEAPVRRPFPTIGADNHSEQSNQVTTSPAFKEPSQIKLDEQFEKNFPEFIDTVENASESLDMSVEDAPNWQETPTNSDSLTSGINSQALSKAGFTNFIIKPRPFDGILFGLFEVPMLSYLNVVEKDVIRVSDGNEKEVLRIYQFSFEDADGAEEIYDFLRTDLKDSLGVQINETNQFGLSSFYINFQTPKEQAFLVVKTKTNVYALSYPKLNEGEVTYFDLVSKLLSDLI